MLNTFAQDDFDGLPLPPSLKQFNDKPKSVFYHYYLYLMYQISYIIVKAKLDFWEINCILIYEKRLRAGFDKNCFFSWICNHTVQ